MKNRKPLICAIALLFTTSQGTVLAEEAMNLADDIETPDALLKITDPEKKNARYGDSNIVISGDGEKHNEIVKPDPLENSLNPEHNKKNSAKDIELKPRKITEEDEALVSPDPLLKTVKPKKNVEENSNRSSSKNNGLEMQDPLLDNMN